MKLTELQKQSLGELSQQFKDILKEQQQNPSSFDHHVNCLRKLEKVTEDYMTFMSPYINWQSSQADKLLDTKFNVFKIWMLKRKLGTHKKILKEIGSIFFDEACIQLVKRGYEGKPVTGFNVNKNDYQKSVKKYQGTFFKESLEESHVATYSISFLDGTELKWHSLDDEQQLEQARRIFEEKVPQHIKPMLVEVNPAESYSGKSIEGNENAEVVDPFNDDAWEQYSCSMM